MSGKELLDGISESEIARMATVILGWLEDGAAEEDSGVHEDERRGRGRLGRPLQGGAVLKGALVDLKDELYFGRAELGAYEDERTGRRGRRPLQGGVGRGAHASEAGGGEAAEGFYEAESVLTAEQELGQSGLPEKLSELFCRDARRYDGAFERY